MNTASAFVDTAPETQGETAQRTRRARPIRRPSALRAAPIIAIVCERYGVTATDLLGKRRHQSLADARHVAMWLLRRAGYSYPEIGMLVGNRDHTTAMSGVENVEQQADADAGFREELEGLVR